MEEETDISAIVDQLKAKLAKEVERSKQLTAKAAEAQSQLALTQVELQTANTSLKELQSNLAHLEELKSEHYQRLISDMFSIPARSASRQTITWALASIVVTALLTFGATYWSLKESADQYRAMVRGLIENQSKAAEDARTRMTRLSDGLDSMQAGMNTYLASNKSFEEQVSQACSALSSEASSFNRYQSLDDIARMYKINGIARLSPISPIVFGQALSCYGVSAELVEQAKKSLPAWDNESLQLYTKWLNVLALQDQNRAANTLELRWAQYADQSDHTNYLSWYWNTPGISIGQVRNLITARLDATRRQLSVYTSNYKTNTASPAKSRGKMGRKGA